MSATGTERSPEETPKDLGLRLEKEREARIDDLQSRYPTQKSTLLPVLWEIQEEHGWVAPEWMEYAAWRCDVAASHVMSVVTFYTMFHRSPPGRYHVQVCRNISCHIMGARDIIAAVEKKIGCGHGERTEDGKFSIEHVECLAGCSWAPVMQINRTLHENLDAASATRILDELE